MLMKYKYRHLHYYNKKSMVYIYIFNYRTEGFVELVIDSANHLLLGRILHLRSILLISINV